LEGKKTSQGLLVSSFACSPETADIEFNFTLSHCMHKGNNLAFHLIQSFKPGETDPETAHKIGIELANRFLKNQYEYVLSTHVDKDHIHNHLIFCAANFMDYRKFVSNRKSYYQIRKLSDKLCEEHGLSIVEPIEDRGKSYKEYMANKEGTSWKSQIRRAADLALHRSLSYEEFLMKLHILGVEVREGKNLAFRKAGDLRFVRAESLGYRFSESRIKERIAAQSLGEDTPKKRMRYRRTTIAFRELKLTEKAMNFIAEQGIDSYEKLEHKQKELRMRLKNTIAEIHKLERKVSEISEIKKQINILQSRELANHFDETINLIRRAATEAAREFLRNKGFTEHFPNSKSLSEEQTKLGNQLEVLYHGYEKDQQKMKDIINTRIQIEKVLKKSLPLEL